MPRVTTLFAPRSKKGDQLITDSPLTEYKYLLSSALYKQLTHLGPKQSSTDLRLIKSLVLELHVSSLAYLNEKTQPLIRQRGFALGPSPFAERLLLKATVKDSISTLVTNSMTKYKGGVPGFREA